MVMALAKEAVKEIRAEILQAAAERFQRFGYGKTNMAEIAADCCMSAGNLYRYFKNKLDIAEAIMRMAMDDAIEDLRGVLKRPGLSARERLRAYILEEMQYTYGQMERYPTLVEQVTQELGARKPILANEYLSASRALLTEILAAGNASGEFQVEDVVEVAEMIQSATMKFRYPQMHSQLTLDQLEREAEGVAGLLVDGIACARREAAH